MDDIRIFSNDLITSMVAVFTEYVFPLREIDVHRLWGMLGMGDVASPWTFVELAPDVGAFAIDYHGNFDEMAIGVTQAFADPDQTSLTLLDDNFSQVVQAVTTILGTPDERLPGEQPAVTWRLENGGAVVVMRGSMVHLHLKSPSSAAFNPADLFTVFNEDDEA